MNATNLIRNLVCQHMPEAAAAAGLISEVDPAAWVAEMSARFPVNVRPVSLGLPGLIEWLVVNGVTTGISHTRALRLEWLKERMREAADREYAARKA